MIIRTTHSWAIIFTSFGTSSMPDQVRWFTTPYEALPYEYGASRAADHDAVSSTRTARIEPFELRLVREIFAPIPTLFILNKVHSRACARRPLTLWQAAHVINQVARGGAVMIAGRHCLGRATEPAGGHHQTGRHQ
jgi:hypothetical protein